MGIDLTISPEFIRDNHVYVHEEDGEIRGFYALCVAGDKAELEYMWVTPEVIGTGIGKELFLDAMERAAKLNGMLSRSLRIRTRRILQTHGRDADW